MVDGAAAMAKANVVRLVRDQLVDVGYGEACLERDYRFVNYLEADRPTCEIPLLAFGVPSHDYRSACVALGFLQGTSLDAILGAASAAGARRSLIANEHGIDVFVHFSVLIWSVGRIPCAAPP